MKIIGFNIKRSLKSQITDQGQSNVLLHMLQIPQDISVLCF